MKLKYILFATIALLSIQSYSQTIRLKGGVNLSDFLYKSEGVEYSSLFNITQPGFQAGMSFEQPISELLSFETGLMVVLKGIKINALDNVYPYGGKMNLFYIDVPITFKANFYMGAKSKWFLAAGPWVDVGFAGNVMAMYNWTGDGQAEKEKIKWGDDEGEIKRFDIGVTFGGGMDFGDWEVGAYFDFGFPELSNSSEQSIKTRLWKLSVGYKL